MSAPKSRSVRRLPLSVERPRVRPNRRRIRPEVPRIRLTFPQQGSPVVLLGNSRVLVGPTGATIAEIYAVEHPVFGLVEHWVYAVDQDLTAGPHLLLAAGSMTTFTTYTDGTARPAFLDEVDGAVYARLALGPVDASADASEHAGPPQWAHLAFEVHAVREPLDTADTLVGFLVRQTQPDGSFLETRIFEGSARPLSTPDDLCLVPVEVDDAQAFIDATLAQLSSPTVLQGTATRGAPPERTPSFQVNGGVGRQIDSGSLAIYGDGFEIGEVETVSSVLNATVGEIGAAIWTEIWSVQDESLLLDGQMVLLSLLGHSGVPLFGRQAILQFAYFPVPEPAVDGSFALVNLPPYQGTVIDTRTYDVYRNDLIGEGSPGAQALTGTLYRELELINGEVQWRDHWVLRDDYQPPDLVTNVSLVPSTTPFQTRQAFLAEQHALRNGASGWSYVEVAYTWGDNQNLIVV